MILAARWNDTFLGVALFSLSMQFAQVLAAVDNRNYSLLQAHLESGGVFADVGGELLERAVITDDDTAVDLLLRGGCGLQGGNGQGVIRASKLGRGRVLRRFQAQREWTMLSDGVINAAFEGAMEGRRVECMDILLSTHQVSAQLLIFAFRHMVTVGSLAGADVMSDYLIGRLGKPEPIRARRPGIGTDGRARTVLQNAI